jgi:hypothetical protein
MGHGPNYHVDDLPLPLLRGVIESEERCLRILLVSPPDLGSSPHVRVTAHRNQSLVWPTLTTPMTFFGMAPPVVVGVGGMGIVTY